MKKKKIILIIILLVITLGLSGLLIMKNGNTNNNNEEEKVIQSNERNENVEQIKITNDTINIRLENDSQSDILGKVYKDEIYTVLETKEDEYYVWCLIETNNNIKGYVAVKYEEENYAEFLEVIESEEVIE